MPRTKGSVDKKPRKRRGGDESSEAQEARIGHNGLSDEQRQALIFQHVESLKAADAKVTAARGARTDLVNVIKQDGFLLEEIKTAIQLETEEGEAAFKQMIERKMRVARWMGLPVDYEPDLFTNPNTDKAYADGKRAGLAGAERKPPYAPGTADHQDWLKGHADGQSVLAKGFKKPASSEPDSEDNGDLRPPHLRRTEAQSDFDDAMADADEDEEGLEPPPEMETATAH